MMNMNEKSKSLEARFDPPSFGLVYKILGKQKIVNKLPGKFKIYQKCSDPELAPAFPYRQVQLKQEVDPRQSFDILPELGRGTFGTVFLCRDKASGLELAAKIVPCKKKKERTDALREIDIMSCLHHPRLIQLYDAFDYENKVYVILELVQGGELFERVIDDDFVLTEKACAVFMKQICEGMEYIHSRSIIHLDMKPENILCLTKTGNRIKIIDFGFARRYDKNKKLQVMFGTPEFTAPEVLNYDEIYFYTDMWSLGVICYVLRSFHQTGHSHFKIAVDSLSGLSPFVGGNDLATMNNVNSGKFSFKYSSFEAVSEDAKDFVRKLLVRDGTQRLTARQALQHKWLAETTTAQSTTELSITKTKLKRYVIKKRWTKAVNTIIALRRMGARIDFDLV
ncbi:myosin light chain kinase [Culex quinquefasciatus]|uniref:Myosin light chain kinase n=2 Tax=Culex pipiens complex TaxID=518105 RepID=B0WY03_CULQU|nr:myosin light chain kinase [Culex quinquefasciatus]|eukprot:XP_001862275.1 myosin light chain kinase [Culex quinquefasciatus]